MPSVIIQPATLPVLVMLNTFLTSAYPKFFAGLRCDLALDQLFNVVGNLIDDREIADVDALSLGQVAGLRCGSDVKAMMTALDALASWMSLSVI